MLSITSLRLILACLTFFSACSWAQQDLVPNPIPPKPMASLSPINGFHALLEPSVRLGHPAMQKALDMLGARYVWGGTSELDGMDCSGFVWRSYQAATGLKLPRTAAEMARQLLVVRPHELHAGDLVFFNTRRKPFSHVGIYLGGGMFAHSPRAGQIARMDSLESPYWLASFDGARRPASRSAEGREHEVFALLLEPRTLDAEPPVKIKRISTPHARKVSRSLLVATAAHR